MNKFFFSIFVIFSITFVFSINAQVLSPIAEIQGEEFLSPKVGKSVLVNKPMFSHTTKFGFVRSNADFPKVLANDENRPERVSDHDAAVA